LIVHLAHPTRSSFMNRAFFLLLSVGGTIITVANCGGTSSLAGRSCPCSDGYVCCEATQVCLASGERCGDEHQDGGLDSSTTVTKDASSEKPVCGAEPKEPPPLDGGFAGADAGGVCPTSTPISQAEIDGQLNWLPPASPQNVCTQQNIDALKAKFKAASGGVTFTDIRTTLGAACAACAFSATGAANWQVFAEASGTTALENSAASCFAQRVGGDCGPRYGAVCGKARFRFETCLAIACPDADCGGASQVAACQVKAQKGACKGIIDAYVAACPNEVDILPSCDNTFKAIATSCSGGPNHTIDTTPLP
jgi:hypothetical protein